MALGAAACVLVLIGAAVTLPHFWRSSASNKPEPAQQAVSAPNSANTAVNHAPADQGPATPAGGNGASNAAPSQAQSVPQQNQADNARTQPTSSRASSSSAKLAPKPSGRALSQEHMKQPTTPTMPATAAQSPPVVPAPMPSQQEAQSSGPTQEEIDKVSEDLMKLHARSDAVRGSLENLKQQQAASGVGLRQDISASASRLDAYLQAADRAVQGGNLASARKNMDRIEEELSKLETFFGK